MLKPPPLLALLAWFGLLLTANAQPVVYKDASSLITGTWVAPNNASESATLEEINADSPFEGSRHYRLTYHFQQWWAGCGLNMDNWGNSPARDFSDYTHLRLAYRGLAPGQQLVIQLRHGNQFGNQVVLGDHAETYTVVEVSMLALTANGQVQTNAVSEIHLSIFSSTQQGSGSVFFDAIELVDLRNNVPASPATLARAAALGTGTNISGWLEAFWLMPFNAYPEVNRYNRSKIQSLRNAGFTTFRLPVIFERLGSASPPYSLDTNHITFSLIDSVIAWAVEMDFRLIIDNHHGYPLTNANYAAELPRLKAVWVQLAKRYGHLDPERYFFEIYNEPDYNISNNRWRAVAQEVLQTIRQHEAVTHSVLIGATFWNSGASLLAFTPLNDPDVIYTFHYYEPYLFTHQGFSWTSPPYFPARSFPLLGEAEEINLLFAALKRWSQMWQVPVNLGEFGVSAAADTDSRCRWIQAVMNAAQLHEFSYCYWEAAYSTDSFGFFAADSISEASCIPCFKTALGLYKMSSYAEPSSSCEPTPHLIVLPNPASDWFCIQFDRFFCATLWIFDAQGRTRAHLELNQRTGRIEIPVHHWTPGKYWLCVRTAEGHTLYRPIIIGH